MTHSYILLYSQSKEKNEEEEKNGLHSTHALTLSHTDQTSQKKENTANSTLVGSIQ